MRRETTNTFSEGLVMDLNPLTTPNNVLTSCLNGTIITYNGNEYVLLNDMGNGRVETAYLPAGYVPVGVTEFGGIVYVVSYNPQLDKSLVGSFPSPERNISSEEASDLVVLLTNDDFGYNSDGAKSFYVLKDLYKDKLNPGDKFVVYAGSNQIKGNRNRLSEYVNDNKTKLVRLSLATITDEGKIVKLTNLRKYIIEGTETYIIPEMTKNSSGFPNVDSYRSLVESPYNVFNSRISGKLLLIAELITVDNFNVTTDVEFDGEGDTKDAKIKVSMDYESDEDVYLFGVLGKVTDGSSVLNKKYGWDNPRETREQLDVELHTVSGYNTKERPQRDIFWELTPCMEFGPIPYLKKSGVIELDKVGTGFIDLSEWRYYIDNNNIQLNWALQSYPEPSHKIAGVRFILSGYNDSGIIDTIVYQVSEKRSYNGSFTETIPFNSTFYKIQDNGQLLPNKLYCVTVEVQYKKTEGGDTSKYKYFHRFLYTTDIFNQQYIEGRIVDFKELIPKLNIGTETEATFKRLSLSRTDPQLGKMFEDTVIEEKDTMSAICLYTKLQLEGKVIPKITESYNLFDIKDSSVSITTKIKDGTISFGSYTVTYTLTDSINMDDYLELRLNDSYTGGLVNLPTSAANMKELAEESTKSKYDLGIKITELNLTKGGDAATFTTNVDIIEFIKAFAKASKKVISYKGVMHPIAYDEETFSKYNLKYSSGKFIGTATCSFGQCEAGGEDGHEWYYDATGDVLRYETQGDKGDELSTDFTTDGIQNAMATAWKSVTGSIAVCIYEYDYDKSSYLSPINKTVKSTWPWRRTGRGTGGSNEIASNGGNGGTAVWNSGNCTDTGVFVFIKRTDGKWCPINMVSNMGTQTQAINVANLKFNKSTTITKNFYNIYTVLASMLNLMYTYDGESLTADKYIPISVYYIPRYNTSFNVKVLNKINTPENITIQIISGETKKDLTRALATELFEKNTDKVENSTNDVLETEDSQFYNNIEPEITANEVENLATYITQNSGIELRDMILEYTKTNYGALITTNTGDVLTSNANLSSSNLYYMSGNNPSKINSGFKFKDIYEWSQNNGKYIPSKGGENNISSLNIANKFIMLDGELRLNESYAPPKTRMHRTQGGKGDDGSLGAFADFAPIDFLQCWEGS